LQSCGYAVPVYTFQRHRTALISYAQKKERHDLAFESGSAQDAKTVVNEDAGPGQATAISADGLKAYWQTTNAESIDGLPAFRDCFKSSQAMTHVALADTKRKLDGPQAYANLDAEADVKLSQPTVGRDTSLIVAGFMAGLCTTAIAARLASRFNVLQ
jgi:hypothetical protein